MALGLSHIISNANIAIKLYLDAEDKFCWKHQLCSVCPRALRVIKQHGYRYAGEATGLDLCTSVLELLQWKADILDEAELLAPLTQVLQQLLASCTHAGDAPSGPPPTAMDSSDDESSSDSEDDAEQHTPQRCVLVLHGPSIAVPVACVFVPVPCAKSGMVA